VPAGRRAGWLALALLIAALAIAFWVRLDAPAATIATYSEWK
jgi:hypothetical protein